MRLGNSSWDSSAGPIDGRSSADRAPLVVDRDRALRVADLDVLKAPGSAVRGQLAAPVGGPGRVVVASQPRAAHVDGALGSPR